MPAINTSVPTENAVLASLSTAFNDHEELWNQMRVYGCVLSGSRALDLFTPGMADPDSDWDLYIHSNGHCIVGMIKAFEKSGVVWESPFKQWEVLFERGGTFRTTKREAHHLLLAFDAHWVTQPGLTLPIINLIEHLRKLELADREPVDAGHTFEHQGKKITIIWHPSQPQYPHIPGLQVLRGRNGTGQQVQLMFAPGRRPTSMISSFHSTSVQSIVSPYGSGHMYHELTRNGLAYTWDENTSGDPLAPRHIAAVEKYKRRGFTFACRQPIGTIVRSLQDGQGSFRSYVSQLSPPDNTASVDSEEIATANLMEARTKLLGALVWTEEDKKTTLMTSGDRPHASEQDPRPNWLYPDASTIITKFAIDPTFVTWHNVAKIVAL